MKHLNKGRAFHSSTQVPLRPLGLWCRRSRAVERQTLRSGRIVRWGNITERERQLLLYDAQLGLAAVAVVLVRCIWQLAASFLSCHFYFLCGSHLTVRQRDTQTHRHGHAHTQTRTHHTHCSWSFQTQDVICRKKTSVMFCNTKTLNWIVHQAGGLLLYTPGEQTQFYLISKMFIYFFRIIVPLIITCLSMIGIWI